MKINSNTPFILLVTSKLLYQMTMTFIRLGKPDGIKFVVPVCGRKHLLKGKKKNQLNWILSFTLKHKAPEL